MESIEDKIGEYCFVKNKKSCLLEDYVLLENTIIDKDKLTLFFIDRDIVLNEYSAQLLSDYLTSFIKENKEKITNYRTNILQKEKIFFIQLALTSFIFLIVYIKLRFFG